MPLHTSTLPDGRLLVQIVLAPGDPEYARWAQLAHRNGCHRPATNGTGLLPGAALVKPMAMPAPGVMLGTTSADTDEADDEEAGAAGSRQGEEDLGGLARLFAGVFNSLEAAGQEIGDDDVEGANDDLQGSGWVVERAESGEWVAVEEELVEGIELAGSGGTRAPKGGISIAGRFFKGGQWIPGKAIDHASEADKERLAEAKAHGEALTADREKARKDRGSVDTHALRNRLAKHADAHELTADERRGAATSARMIHRHHGELAAHRLEELADRLERALDAVPEENEGLRKNIGRQLAQLHLALGHVRDKGVTGEVKGEPAGENSAELRGDGADSAVAGEPGLPSPDVTGGGEGEAEAGRIYGLGELDHTVKPFPLGHQKLHAVGVSDWAPDPEFPGGQVRAVAVINGGHHDIAGIVRQRRSASGRESYAIIDREHGDLAESLARHARNFAAASADQPPPVSPAEADAARARLSSAVIDGMLGRHLAPGAPGRERGLARDRIHDTRRLLERLPHGAVLRLEDRLKNIKLVASKEDVAAEAEKILGRPPLGGSKAAGCYIGGKAEKGGGSLVINGDHEDIYVHELGHTIDDNGDGTWMSDHTDWSEAWRAEIAAEGHPLSKYAATDPGEGFAEFVRAAHGKRSTATMEQLERDFPLCSAFFRKRGLIHAATTGAGQGAGDGGTVRGQGDGAERGDSGPAEGAAVGGAGGAAAGAAGASEHAGAPGETGAAVAPAPSLFDRRLQQMRAEREAAATATAQPATHAPAAPARHPKEDFGLWVNQERQRRSQREEVAKAVVEKKGHLLSIRFPRMPTGGLRDTMKKIGLQFRDGAWTGDLTNPNVWAWSQRIVDDMPYVRGSLDGPGGNQAAEEWAKSPPPAPSPGFTGLDANGHQWQDGKQVARGEQGAGTERPAGTPSPDVPPADQGATEAPTTDTPPPDAAPQPDGTKKAKDGTTWAHAPAGGAVSPVNGQFYLGGRWMPIHGLSAGQGKAPKGQGKGDAPTAPGEGQGRGGRQPRPPMTPEQIEELKAERARREQVARIKASPLADMIDLGDSDDFIRAHRGWHPGLRHWKEFAEEVGSKALEELRQALTPIIDRAVPADKRADFDKWDVDEVAKNGEWVVPKKHLREHPESLKTAALLGAALKEADDTELAAVADKMSEIRDRARGRSTEKDQAARAEGYFPNKFPGVTADGKKVKPGQGYVRKNEQTGKYETYTAEEVHGKLPQGVPDTPSPDVPPEAPAPARAPGGTGEAPATLPRTPAFNMLRDDLRALRRDGGFRGLSADDPARLASAIAAEHPGSKQIDVGAEFDAALRRQAEKARVKWDVVEKALASDDPVGRRNLGVLVSRAAAELEAALGKERSPLVLHGLDGLAKWGAAPGEAVARLGEKSGEAGQVPFIVAVAGKGHGLPAPAMQRWHDAPPMEGEAPQSAADQLRDRQAGEDLARRTAAAEKAAAEQAEAERQRRAPEEAVAARDAAVRSARERHGVEAKGLAERLASAVRAKLEAAGDARGARRVKVKADPSRPGHYSVDLGHPGHGSSEELARYEERIKLHNEEMKPFQQEAKKMGERHLEELAAIDPMFKPKAAAGRPVPPEVLADYPDLAAKAPAAPSPAPPAIPTKKVQTSRGERLAHAFEPDQAFWSARKAGRIPDNVTVRKNNQTGEWEATVWGADEGEIRKTLERMGRLPKATAAAPVAAPAPAATAPQPASPSAPDVPPGGMASPPPPPVTSGEGGRAAATPPFAPTRPRKPLPPTAAKPDALTLEQQHGYSGKMGNKVYVAELSDVNGGDFSRDFVQGRAKDRNAMFQARRKGRGTWDEEYTMQPWRAYETSDYNGRQTVALLPSIASPGEMAHVDISRPDLHAVMTRLKKQPTASFDLADVMKRYAEIAHHEGEWDRATLQAALDDLEAEKEHEGRQLADMMNAAPVSHNLQNKVDRSAGQEYDTPSRQPPTGETNMPETPTTPPAPRPLDKRTNIDLTNAGAAYAKTTQTRWPSNEQQRVSLLNDLIRWAQEDEKKGRETPQSKRLLALARSVGMAEAPPVAAPAPGTSPPDVPQAGGPTTTDDKATEEARRQMASIDARRHRIAQQQDKNLSAARRLYLKRKKADG